jgi:hypothetical protein
MELTGAYVTYPRIFVPRNIQTFIHNIIFSLVYDWTRSCLKENKKANEL